VAYPFSIQLPEDLPPTIFHKSNKVKALQASLRYYLIAELVKESSTIKSESEV
jgi:hypothetical protein